MKRNISIIALCAFTLGLSFLGGYSFAGGEKHPQIHAAMNKLHEAKNHLEHAAHDFGGHRVAAIGHIDQAISELEQALNFDKK